MPPMTQSPHQEPAYLNSYEYAYHNGSYSECDPRAYAPNALSGTILGLSPSAQQQMDSPLQSQQQQQQQQQHYKRSSDAAGLDGGVLGQANKRPLLQLPDGSFSMRVEEVHSPPMPSSSDDSVDAQRKARKALAPAKKVLETTCSAIAGHLADKVLEERVPPSHKSTRVSKASAIQDDKERIKVLAAERSETSRKVKAAREAQAAEDQAKKAHEAKRAELKERLKREKYELERLKREKNEKRARVKRQADYGEVPSPTHGQDPYYHADPIARMAEMPTLDQNSEMQVAAQEESIAANEAQWSEFGLALGELMVACEKVVKLVSQA